MILRLWYVLSVILIALNFYEYSQGGAFALASGIVGFLMTIFVSACAVRDQPWKGRNDSNRFE